MYVNIYIACKGYGKRKKSYLSYIFVLFNVKDRIRNLHLNKGRDSQSDRQKDKQFDRDKSTDKKTERQAESERFVIAMQLAFAISLF